MVGNLIIAFNYNYKRIRSWIMGQCSYVQNPPCGQLHVADFTSAKMS